jgi:hypothetical protein
MAAQSRVQFLVIRDVSFFTTFRTALEAPLSSGYHGFFTQVAKMSKGPLMSVRHHGQSKTSHLSAPPTNRNSCTFHRYTYRNTYLDRLCILAAVQLNSQVFWNAHKVSDVSTDCGPSSTAMPCRQSAFCLDCGEA